MQGRAEARHNKTIIAETKTAHLGGHVEPVQLSVRMQAENRRGENIDEPQIARPLVPCGRFANLQRRIDEGTEFRFYDARLAH